MNSSNNPSVSVIVPCYNYGRFIAETLKSLQAQTLQDWECIVVDDGSKDNSAQVVQAFVLADSRIKYIYQENSGLPAARNAGIKASKGNYIQFLDADDLLKPDKLRLQSEYLNQNSEVQLVYSGLRYFYDGTNRLIFSPHHENTAWTLDKSGNGLQLLPFLVISCVIMPPMPMIRRDAILETIGIFIEDLPSCEDWEFWIRCCYKNIRFQYIEEINALSMMRLHANSMTRNRIVMVNSLIEVRHRLRPHLETPALISINERLLNNDYLEKCIVIQQNEGHLRGAIRAFKKAKKRKSILLFFEACLTFVLPPSFSLKLLSLQRSLQKHYFYLKFK